MFCAQCGTKAKDGAKFCSACGVALGAKEITTVVKKKPKEKGSKWLIFAAGGIGPCDCGCSPGFCDRQSGT